MKECRHIRHCPCACALCLVMSGEVQDGGAKLILLQVRGPGPAAAGFSRCVRGMVPAEVHRSRPHHCCLSSGDRSATSASLTSLRDPALLLAAAAMSGPGNKRTAGDGGSGPPEKKLSREEKTTTTLIEPIRLGGISSTVRGLLPQPSQLLSPHHSQLYSQFSKFSRIHFTQYSAERNQGRDVCR